MSRFPDAEANAVTFIRTLTDRPVSTRVPNPRPPVFVRVWRTGGAPSNRILDRPLLTVQAWGATEHDTVTASDLARDIHDAYLARHPLSIITGPYYDPDPDTGIARYSFNVQPSVRAHA